MKTATITLPVSLNPISRRKDKSVKLSFETRELMPTEVLTLMSMEGNEGWLLFGPNEINVEEMPDDDAEVEGKKPSQRLRASLYVLYKQLAASGTYLGTFQTFYDEKMEIFIERVKDKIHD